MKPLAEVVAVEEEDGVVVEVAGAVAVGEVGEVQDAAGRNASNSKRLVKDLSAALYHVKILKKNSCTWTTLDRIPCVQALVNKMCALHITACTCAHMVANTNTDIQIYKYTHTYTSEYT